MKKTILLTGASGCLGQAILRQNHWDQFTVRAFSRGKPEYLPSAAEWIQGDLRDLNAYSDLLQGIDIVIHAAALTSPKEKRRAVLAVNVDASLRLYREAQALGVQQFLLISSASVYGEQGGVHRELPPTALDPEMTTTLYARSKIQAEILLWKEARANAKTNLMIIRPTILLDQKASWVKDPLRLMKRGWPVVPHGPLCHGNFITSDAAAKWILERLSESPLPDPRVLNLTSMQVRWETYFEALAQSIPTRIRKIPRSFEKVLGSFQAFQGFLNLLKKENRYECSLPIQENFYDWLADQDPHPPQTVTAQTGYRFHPRRVLQVRSEEDLTQLVSAAERHQIPINSAGSLHSFAPLYKTSGWLLRWNRLTGLIRIDENEFTFWAGTLMSDVVKILEAHGRSLRIHGEILSQTLAGAVCTGTHGSSLIHRSLASEVTRLRVLSPDHRWTQWKPGDPEFARFTIAKTRPGIITQVTLKTIPLRCLEERTRFIPITRMLSQEKIVEPALAHEYGSWMIYPVQGLARERVIFESKSSPTFTPRVRRISQWVCRISERISALLWWQGLKYAAFLFRPQRRVGAAWSVLATEVHPRSGEFFSHDLEIGVSLSDAAECVKRIMEFLKRHSKYSLPRIQVRFQEREFFEKSASFHHAIAWIECWINQRVPEASWKRIRADFQKSMEGIEYRVHPAKSAPEPRLFETIDKASCRYNERETAPAFDIKAQVDWGEKVSPYSEV